VQDAQAERVATERAPDGDTNGQAERDGERHRPTRNRLRGDRDSPPSPKESIQAVGAW
jgi:hypothetical protein